MAMWQVCWGSTAPGLCVCWSGYQGHCRTLGSHGVWGGAGQLLQVAAAGPLDAACPGGLLGGQWPFLGNLPFLCPVTHCCPLPAGVAPVGTLALRDTFAFMGQCEVQEPGAGGVGVATQSTVEKGETDTAQSFSRRE